MTYDYLDRSLLIKQDYTRYEEARDEIISGLEDQAEPEDVSAEDLLEDEELRIPSEVFSGSTTADPLHRHRIMELGEKRTVYTFEHDLGLEVVGDYAMIRKAAPEYIPDAAIPMPGSGSD